MPGPQTHFLLLYTRSLDRVRFVPQIPVWMATTRATTSAAEGEHEEEHATGTDAKDDERAAFLQASATLLLNISPPLESSLQPPSANDVSANDALLQLAQSVMEAQAPRPTFSDFASVPADNPFSSPPVGDS